MKTFTTYAEKKAKQFLNLLQGYTKGIRFTAILILLLMGVSNVWGASVTPKGKYFYFKTSDTWKVDGARFAVCFQWKEGGGQDDAWVSCIGVPNVTDMYYVQAPDKYWDMYFCRMNGSNQTNSWSNKWNQTGKLQYDGTKNYWTKSSGWNENTTYSTYAPPLSLVTLENNGTSIVSGSGTSSSPYLVYTGTTIKVKASGTKAVNDPDATMYYDFKQGDTSKQDGTSTTYSFTASSTVNTSYTINLDGYTKISSTSSTKTSATALYFKTIEKTYTVTINNDGHGTTTPSGAQSNVGQVTGLSIQATPAANYEFVNWTITSGSGSFGSTTSTSTTFKPTSAATIQANFRSTATNSLTVVAGAGIESVAGSKDPVTLGNTNAITATPKTGYTFSTWTAEPAANATFASATSANTTVTVKNGSVTVTASATENMSTLTTFNQYDAGNPGYEVPTASVSSIGYETTATITATTDDDYTLTSWTLTNCTRTDGGADNATTITVRSNGDGKAATVIANYTKIPTETVYLINTGEWGTVKIYHWGGGSCASYPGENMTKTAEQIAGFNVYEYTMQEGTTPTGMLFNCGGDECKTGDLTWQNGKYYAYSKGVWYDTKAEAEEALAPDPLATDVYLAGTMNEWSTTANEFRKATDEATTASVTVALTAQTYEFKLVISGDWKGNDGTMKRGGVGVHDDGWSFDGGNNCKIVADIAGDYTFTWNLTTNKLTVAYPPLPKHQVTATVNPAESGTVTGTGEYEQGATATLTATPNDGFVFVNWTKGGEEVSTETTYTFTVTEAVELVANFEEAQEETHTVTVSYMCNTTSIKDVTTPSVGVETPVSIEAPVIEGYTFQSWTIGDGIKTDNANTDNPISITTKSTGPYTLTANYTENPYVYFVNTARWATIYAYAWKDAEDNGWPGKAMTKEPEKISGFDVYKYVKPTGKNYDKLIFNQGNDDGKTGDLDWEDGKYYVYSAGQWVDKNEVADLLPKPVIYFKNNPKWKEVYVYFHTGDYWSDADNGGSGANGLTEANGRVCKMEKVGETDIYKYDYEASGIVPGNVIAFTEAKQPNYGNFHQTQAVYRTDYNPNMELFIPQATYETKNETKYYNKGLWMKYNSTESGYTITGDFNEWNQESDKFTSETSGGYIFQKELLLSSGNSYEFKIKNIKNDWFRTSTAIKSTKNTDIEFTAGDGSNVTITALSDGYYTFSIDLSTGKMLVSVEYPLMEGDYRMVYIESETKGTKPYTKFHPAQSIRGITEGDKLDTVSFFINKTKGKNPAILLQRCSEIDGATITWEDIAIQYINGNGGANPVLAQAPAKKSAELHIGDGCPAVTKDAVYNFVLEQTNTGAQILVENTHLYEGNYYIRTDGAAGGWSKYNTNPDNIMTHSQTALTHGGYDYYFCEWMLKGNNVKYVVANDYSYCVSDTLAKDDIVTDENGNLPADANVRYTWNSSTNALKRAYINGSGTIADRYLVLIGNEHLKDASGNTFPVGTGDRTGLYENETTFADMGNWLYQVDIKASEETLVKLTANYNGKIQYFKGSDSETEQLIKGSENYYILRLIYDFKTNYLLSGLVGNQEITDDLELEEVMILRSHHDEAQTLKISDDGSVAANKAYGVMTFNKSTLNGAGSEHERALYWVSFPFDVKLDEAFGFGNYGEHWIMEYYDGKERAENGLWKEPTYSYWKYITDPTNYTLEAGQGYVLCLDLALLGNNAEFWKHDNTEIALYFPSNGKNTIVINNQATQRETTVPKHTCTIERDDRDIEDSNWNIIGVPAYTKIAGINSQNLNFYYQYITGDDPETKDIDETNSYRVQNELTFNTMHAYMVQFAGTINWTEQATSIAALAARKSPAGKDQYTLRLALQQEDAQCDHTFIRLQEDNATAEFDMNYDLCKIINSGANIYSMIGNVEVAANVLPMEERVIPLGLDIHETGNYTFAMPDGTDGITATLIDYETGTETNLLLADYTTELREGINNERFALRVRPNHVATEVENTIQTDGNDNAKKYIIDGALYLLRDGKLYDAQGRMVQQ